MASASVSVVLAILQLSLPAGGLVLTTSHLRGLARPTIGSWGFDLDGQNTSTAPGEDFFNFANGGYIDKAEIPADRTRWGNFDMLAERAEEDVRKILESDGSGKPGRLYQSYMGTTRIEELGSQPLVPLLNDVKGVKSSADFATLVARCNFDLFPSPLYLTIDQDSKDPDHYVLSIDQGGLGLPDRDYYLQKSFADKKQAYREYMVQLFQMIEWPEPEQSSKAVLAFEEAIAEASLPREAMRDPVKMYNPTTLAKLGEEAPGFDWAAFFKASAGGDEAAAKKAFPSDAKIIVGPKAAVIGIAKLLGETKLETLRSWAAFHTVSAASAYLSSDFVNASFAYSKRLSGQEEISARYKRGVRVANRLLGELIGREYVKRHFPEASKLKLQALADGVKTAFGERLDNLDWMTKETKEKAKEKLGSFKILVGYPDKIQDYSGLHVDEQDLFGNVRRASAFAWQEELKRLNQRVDKDEWLMDPQTINAYFQPLTNRLVFPAAILQPPFFDPDADDAVNYGGIGGVIGHEMTHGFDDSGRQFDATGRLNDWWTKEDEAKFNAKAEAYGRQFANFDLGLGNLSVNPKLTMGENIADLGGLTVALAAYRTSHEKLTMEELDAPMTSLSAQGSGASELDPQVEGQRRVFFGWAQVWREKMRKEALVEQVTTDPHSPPRARVNIPTRNMAEWYEAFGITEKDASFVAPGDRVTIW